MQWIHVLLLDLSSLGWIAPLKMSDQCNTKCDLWMAARAAAVSLKRLMFPCHCRTTESRLQGGSGARQNLCLTHLHADLHPAEVCGTPARPMGACLKHVPSYSFALKWTLHLSHMSLETWILLLSVISAVSWRIDWPYQKKIIVKSVVWNVYSSLRPLLQVIRLVACYFRSAHHWLSPYSALPQFPSYQLSLAVPDEFRLLPCVF